MSEPLRLKLRQTPQSLKLKLTPVPNLRLRVLPAFGAQGPQGVQGTPGVDGAPGIDPSLAVMSQSGAAEALADRAARLAKTATAAVAAFTDDQIVLKARVFEAM